MTMTATTETEAMAKKPTMTGKKDWSAIFKSTLKHDQEIPVVVRTGRRAPFEFDSMKIGSMFFVPVEFWMEWGGLRKDIVAGPKGPARNKDAIRRSFYNWRDDKAADAKEQKRRAGLALAFSDQFDPKTKEYTGVNVYMAERSEDDAEADKAKAKPKAK